MLTYILQIIIFQVLFLAVYDFFLSKETFHTHNRWYLLGTPILSFVLPLIKIPTFQKAMPQEIMILLPEVMLSPQKVIEQTTFYTDGSINYLNLLFWIGVALFAVVFLIKLFNVIQLITKNETIQKHFYRLVFLPKQNNAFSFFNYIFLGKDISKEKQEAIIEHELIHATEKHSLDLLFFELLKIVMWFNPMIYFYQKRITLLHEYISDAAIIKNTQKHHYFNTLLSQTFQVENISFVNQFYKHSLIKKRIIMITKNKSNQIRKAKYLLLLPLLASMLIYTSCGVDKKTSTEIEEVYEDVPFATIQEVPVFPGCTGTRKEKSDCLNKGIQKFVVRNFNGNLAGNLGLSKGNKRIWVQFRINEEGKITQINARAPHPKLQEEAIRVVRLLPKMKPGKHLGKAVGMKYTLPITFNIDGTDTNEIDEKFKEIKELLILKKGLNKNNEDVPFAIIEEVPVFPGCTGTRKEKSDCLNKGIRSFVVENFNADLSKKVGLSPGKKKIWVVFRIDESGNATNINARAPHPKLKEEAMRVVRLLPKMEPGEHLGKAVGMKYTLPISFTVE